MSRTVKVIRGYAKYNNKQINWMEDTADQVRAKSAYNAALQELEEFLLQYESGEISEDYLISIVEEK